MPKRALTGQRRRIAIAMEIEEPWPHHQQVFAGVQRYAREHPDWQCEIDQYPTYASRERGLSSGRYDGVVARAWPALQTRLNRLGVPLVNVLYQSHKPGLSGVYHDPVALGNTAAEHLLQRGYKRISYLYDPNTRSTSAMRDAFRGRVLQEEREYSEVPIGEDATDPKSYVKMESALKRWITRLRPPTAACFQTPYIARLAIQLCHAKGLVVPQDVAILTYQNLKSVVEIQPQISSIDDNYEKVGYEAAAMLERMMAGQPGGEVIHIPPRGIHARESTDYYAVEDPLVAEALRYISKNLSRKLRADDIAYELAVSVSSLQKRFAKALGRGMSEEILRLRLSSVKVMLAEPEHTLAKIAATTGFASAAVLNHAFKRELKMTPGAYRKKVLSG